MSNHNSVQKYAPKVRDLRAPSLLPKGVLPPTSTEFDSAAPDKHELLIAGQGCITFTIDAKEKQVKTSSVEISFLVDQKAYKAFRNSLSKDDKVKLKADPVHSLVVTIDMEGASFSVRKKAGGQLSKLKDVRKPSERKLIITDGYKPSIDTNPKCVYWISVDSLNKYIRYGKGEMRRDATLLECKFDIPRTVYQEILDEEAGVTRKDAYPEFTYLKNFTKRKEDSSLEFSHAWKDPITAIPPTVIKPTSELTMNEAARNTYVTPSSLSSECQELYGNISGEQFTLNTPDFPDFEQAIEYSMRNPKGIAYKIIKYKLDHSEFSNDSNNITSMHKEDDYKEVYLRITLGASRGESPGIPYVMEVWPPGCASPVHHHGFTHAVVRVLRGTIDVDIYRMLPGKENSKAPLASTSFSPGEVTYLMPHANQFHRLRNEPSRDETCITIQCYAYAKDDDVHYPTFDYIENNELGHFDPVSDCDFEAFKQLVKSEWKDYLKERFWENSKDSKK